MKAVRSCAVLVALSWSTSATALDPQRAASQYVVKTWGATSLGSNTVHSIGQTKDGYLWLGTSGGLVRYDGAAFVLYSAINTADFADGGVSAVIEGADGVLYVGTTSGVLMDHRNGAFARLSGRSRAGPILSLASRRAGGVWIAKDSLRPMWYAGELKTYDHAPTLTGRAFAEEEGGVLWIGTREGLLREESGQFTWHPKIRDSVQALRFDRDGALWVGTPHGLHRLEGDTLQTFTSREGLCHDNVTAVVEDRDANLWVGTTGGLCRRSGGRFESFTWAEGLSDDDVRSVFEDHEGTLWVGTGDGLTSISDGGFVTYGRFEGVADGRTTAVIGSHDGSVWVGTASGEVVRLRTGAPVETFVLPSNLGRESVVVLYEARDRVLWAATENGRLFRLVGGRVSDVTPREPAGHRVVCIFEDDEGLVFFVPGMDMGQGLSYLQDSRFVRLPFKGPALGFLHAVHRDERGFWMASSHGLAVMTGATMTRHREGLPEARIRWLTPEGDGGWWLATAGGIGYFKDETFQVVTSREGLPESYLRVILDDGLGHLWVGGSATLFRVAKRELRDVMVGRAARISPVVFDSSDGLRTTEALLSNSPGFRAADGRLWFATAKGVAVIDPRRISTDEPAPPARVEKLTVDGESQVRAEYDPGRGEVTVEYSAAGLSDRIRFRHRLEGLDDGWVDAGNRRQAYYSNLQPGRYRFLVMASNRHGVWNGEPVALAFAIRPPFHQTPLFYVVAAAVFGAGAVAAHRLRLRQMQSRFAAVIGERTRIARELHDTLAQGVAGIRLQVETGLDTMAEDAPAARDHFQLAGAMARTSLAEVRRSIWVLRAQTTKGQDGLVTTLSESLRHLTAGGTLRPTVTIAGEAHALPPAVEHNLLRILHELVLNAVRHSGAATLAVALDFGRDGVELRVKDDGRGFDAEAHLAASGAEHFGLLGMVERAEALGGKLELHSRPGEGTEVVCRLPYDL
jgi:signal transduction histidine kinase/ligand-binding sensor domain-containing protein